MEPETHTTPEPTTPSRIGYSSLQNNKQSKPEHPAVATLDKPCHPLAGELLEVMAEDRRKEANEDQQKQEQFSFGPYSEWFVEELRRNMAENRRKEAEEDAG